MNINKFSMLNNWVAARENSLCPKILFWEK